MEKNRNYDLIAKYVKMCAFSSKINICVGLIFSVGLWLLLLKKQMFAANREVVAGEN